MNTIHMPSISSLYNSVFYNKSRDKIDTILEPLQSMIQFAMLSICPLGTKLQIHENILYLQSPTITQPFTRWYHSDKKDDLFFLYSVIKRFIKWYNPAINSKSPLTEELYQLITSMSIEGLNNLFKTYSSADSNTVIQVIQMYKNLLEFNNDKILLDEYMLDMDKNKINIDEVFEKIINIYEPTILHVVYHTLLLIQEEQDITHQTNIINGLNSILNKTNIRIKDWVKMNLTL
jgi:hypothetical protein